MNTEITPTKTNLRVRRDENGNETSATLTVQDEAGNSVTLRYEDANQLRGEFGRFFEEQRKELATILAPHLERLNWETQEALNTLRDNTNTFIENVFADIGVTRSAVTRVAKDTEKTVETLDAEAELSAEAEVVAATSTQLL